MEDVDCCCVKEKFEMDIHLYDSSSVVAKKRTATKLPKARKVTLILDGGRLNMKTSTTGAH